MIKYYVDSKGNYIGGFEGAVPPSGSIEVKSPPDHARQKWDGKKFLPYAPSALDQIIALELARTPRREREARMGVTGAQEWLDSLDAEIEVLRGKL